MALYPSRILALPASTKLADSAGARQQPTHFGIHRPARKCSPAPSAPLPLLRPPAQLVHCHARRSEPFAPSAADYHAPPALHGGGAGVARGFVGPAVPLAAGAFDCQCDGERCSACASVLTVQLVHRSPSTTCRRRARSPRRKRTSSSPTCRWSRSSTRCSTRRKWASSHTFTWIRSCRCAWQLEE